jgi:hypothetical protein
MAYRRISSRFDHFENFKIYLSLHFLMISFKYPKNNQFYVLELRPTTFGTPPLSKGSGRPEEGKSTLNSKHNSSCNRQPRQDIITHIFVIKLLNKLLVLRNTTIQFWSFDPPKHCHYGFMNWLTWEYLHQIH